MGDTSGRARTRDVTQGGQAGLLNRRTAVLGAIAGALSLVTASVARADAPVPMPAARASDGAAAPSQSTAPIATAAARGPVVRPAIGGAPTGGTAPVVVPKPRRDTVAIGVYIPGAAQDTGLLDVFEQTSGKRMDIVHWYQPWGYTKGWYAPPLDVAALAAVGARGSVPMITWEAWGEVNGADPSHVATIATGVFDGYIDSWANGLKAYGRPVYLRLFHEMNNQSYPWAHGTNGNTALDLVAAWRYVHGRFARAGATNVRWVWSPNTENDLVPFSALYPGDAYVDWFGVDGYNGGTLLSWGGWLPAQQLFDRSYRSFQAINGAKPVMIAEIGSVEQGGSKPAWIADLFADTIPRAFPNVRAVVWFDDDLTGQGQADWRVDSTPASLAAFNQAVAAL